MVAEQSAKKQMEARCIQERKEAEAKIREVVNQVRYQYNEGTGSGYGC